MSGDDYFDRLTAEERFRLAACLPSDEDVMLGWALPVLARPKAERAALVAAQIEVLRPLWADPAAWCLQALKIAERERTRHG